MRNGAKNLVRLGRLERPLNALSTHSLCRLGYRRESAAPVYAQTRYDGHPRSGASSPPKPWRRRVEDQAGFDPAVSLRCRLKRPARSTATVTGPNIVSWRTRVVTIHRPTG